MLELALTGIGWVLAGLALGLWLGERGRRRDLQWIAETAIGPRKARMETEAPTFSNPEIDATAQRVTDFEVDEVTEHLMGVARLDGQEISREDAEAEAKRMVEEAANLEGFG